MKKLLLLFFVLLFSSTLVQAQNGWTLGVNAGVPVGDAEEVYSFHAGADVAYRFDIIELLDLGVMAGYSHYFGEEIEGFEVDDANFIPLAANARLRILAILFVGTDLGYAIALNDAYDGGLYIRPQLGVNLGILDLVGSYEIISVDNATGSGSIGSINAGIEFRF